MRTYLVTFTTPIHLTVTVEAEGEQEAADLAWQPAEDYLQTIVGDHQQVRAEASLDGIGADDVTEVPA